MTDYEEFRIIGFDPEHPPLVQNRPCIDLVLQLDQAAPTDWCKEFINIVGKHRYAVKLDPDVGIFIETWVKQSSEIADTVELLKNKVSQCNLSYQAKLKAQRGIVTEADTEVKVSPEQIALNDLVSKISFDE